MTSKRKIGEEPTAREKKKQKVTAARTIAVQIPDIPSENSAAGPSNPVPTTSLKGLPSAIDVEKFAEARAFEIDAMHTAMDAASAASTQRAWQTLPRHLRRRAASHDVRRVPARLRERARAEMDPVRKKALGHSMPKLGKDRQVSRTEAFLKRQRDKTWLETHIWHAKRMKMENMWGFRLAVHPTEKAYRPSHRASIHGSILHDASYYSILDIRGPEYALIAILNEICDLQGPGPGSKRCLGGSRTLESHVYKPSSYPFGLIGPITLIWKPVQTLKIDESTSLQTNSDDKAKGRNKNNLPDLNKTIRTLWLKFHPAIHEEVVSALKTATSQMLEVIKSSSNSTGDPVEVEITDIRSQINVFEIMGPKANQVIRGALNLAQPEEREDLLKFWSSLTDLQTSGQLPRGMIIGFKVVDPRLKFPPKNAKPRPLEIGISAKSAIVFPSVALATTEIWEKSVRNKLAVPRYKKKDLDERRSKNVVPGTPLNPLRQDDRVPVMLIQRSQEPSVGSTESQPLHGWTFIVPAGWSMAFLSTLTFTGTRVGGQRERQTQAFEAGVCYFPRDYPFTLANKAYMEERMRHDEEKWNKKPPAKRVNYQKLGTLSPWKADWDVVLGLREASRSDNDNLVTTQREGVIDTSESEALSSPRWHLRGSEVLDILPRISGMFNQGAGLLSEINKLRMKRSIPPLDASIKAADLLQGGLVSVRLSMCKKGAPQDFAMIYSLDDGEVRKCEKTAFQGTVGNEFSDEDTAEELELGSVTPSQGSFIGYVTTGHFSLSRGEGFAIGAVSIVHILALQQQAIRLQFNKASNSRSPLLVKVRNPDGHVCRAALLEIVAE